MPPLHDEIPWCAAGLNYVCSILDVPRARSVRARAWLTVGAPVQLAVAQVGWDVVVYNRGGKPDPTALDGPGHVGLFAGRHADGRVLTLGGNQGNRWSIQPYPASELLGVRRLLEAA